MEKPDWVFGNEKRFYDFIGSLNEGKILLVSHTDLDGIGSARIIDEAVKSDEQLFLNYPELEEGFVDRVKEREPKKVIISDLFFKAKNNAIPEIEKFADVLIIDHHSPERDFSSEKTVHMNAQNSCAAYLAYYLFSRSNNLEKLDWLAACSTIADVAYRHKPEFMREVFEKYGDKFETLPDGQIRKSGSMWDAQWKITLALVATEPDYKRVFDSLSGKFGDIGDLEKLTLEVQREYDSLLSKFDNEREEISGGYLWELDPHYKITSLLTSEVSFRYQNKTCIFVSPLSKGEGYKFSARRQDGAVDLNKFSGDLIKGFPNSTAGGHPRASGGSFPKEYLAEFKKRLGI